MPTLQDNTIVQNSTTSNQGSNKQPKFSARSHFFLEDEGFAQVAAQKFGVLSTSQFRTTSLVTVSNKKLVAICSGQVFIQPQTGNAAKVNLVLKPYRQPVSGLSVKYFIYRGLPKAEFLDANDKVLASGSGFITFIRNEFNNFYSQDPNNPAPDFLGKFIGYPDPNAPANEAQQLSDFIDSYFYKLSQTFDNETGSNPKHGFELPMIPAGTHLATVSGEIGLDIVLNYGDYYIENDPCPFKLDLQYARASEYILNAAGVATAYEQKLLRETATWFVDPAAYYGLHANGGNVYKFGQTQPKKTAGDIYALIAAFVTKNNIYIYVQSDRQRSYNFYGNYNISSSNSNNIKIGTAEANLAEADFATDQWPVKVFTTAPASGAGEQTIAMQFTTDRKPNTSLFAVMASISSPNEEGFVPLADLIKEPDVNGTLSYFTKTVIVNSPVAGSVNLASFIQLLYMGKEIVLTKPGIDDGDPSTPIPIVEYSTKYMDEQFDLIDAVSFLEAEKIYHVHSYKPSLYNQQPIEARRGTVVSFTQRTQNTIAVSDTQNLTLVTYLAIAGAEQSGHSNFDLNSSSNKEATGYGVQDITGMHSLPNLPSNEYVEFKLFDHESGTITGVTLKGLDGSLPTTLVLGISSGQNDQLKLLASGTRNPKIFLEPLGNENGLVASNMTKYRTYRVGILTDRADYKQEVLLPSEDTIIFTIDGLTFYSKEYSDYIERYTKLISLPEPIMTV